MISREKDIYDLIQKSKTPKEQTLEGELFKLRFDSSLSRFSIRDKETNAMIVIGDYSRNHLSFATRDDKLNAAIEKSFTTYEKKQTLDNVLQDAKNRKNNHEKTGKERIEPVR